MQLHRFRRRSPVDTTVLIISAASLAVLPFPASAQSNDLRVRVGIGAQLQPEFIGADGTQVNPLWDLAFTRGSEPFDFEAPDDNFDIKVYSKKGLSFGPVANIQSGRKNSDVGASVGKVSTTIEVGAFAQYKVSETVRLRTEVRRGIGGHDGWVASVGGDRIWRDGDRYVLSIGPRVLFSNAQYQRAWFGVDASAAAASGLSKYRPSGGLHAVALTSGMTYQFNPVWGAFGFARYERLIGGAAKSPIVKEIGSRNQPSAGMGITYSFTVKR